MAGAGSVQWMFQQLGVIELGKEQMANSKFSRDEFDLQMIDAGAEDITEDEEIEIKTKMENFQKVLAALKEIHIEPNESGLQWVAKDTVPVSAEVSENLQGLFAELDENDDVEDYFTNAE
mgnify:CR=1 FL=1